jgi:predicted Zn-dependent protease
VLRKLFVLVWAVILASALTFAQSGAPQSSVPQSSDDKNGDQNNKNSDKSSDQSKDAKDDDAFYHHTGINDINAIGSRNVGCNRGLGNWYSLDSQVNMGRQFAQQVEQSSHLITDPVVNEYVNRIGQNLARNSDTHLPFTIKIIDIEEPNAFALPGGFMFVHAGTLLLADDESELAGVMAHEIGHVAACHAARGATRGTLASLAMIPIMIATGPWVGLGAQEVAGFAVPATFMKFSRGFEAQADYLGIQYAYKTGYDPVGMINFFEKLEALEKKKPGMIAKAYLDHPQTPDRIEKSQHEIASILPPRDQYIVDTSEFQQVKKRLALIMKHRQLNDHNNEVNPDLRRTVDGNGPDQPDNGDDRPVIKRKPGSTD